MKVIGISGTNGSGKDTLGEILAKDYGWLFISVTNLLRAEATRRGLPTERLYTSKISAEWRREFGLGVLVDKAVEQYKEQSSPSRGLAISSLRNPGEVEEIHRLGGKMVWVDADPKVRYNRTISRNRGKEDVKSFEQFLAEEQDEMNQGGDAATLNMEAVKAKADIFLTNNTDSIEEFKRAVQKALGL